MNIFGLGPMEILLIVVLALIVFGPAKLPEIMGQVGRAIADFRRATSSLSDEFNRTIQAELQETRSIVDETKSAVTGAHASINAAMTGTPAVPAATAAPALTAAAPTPTASYTNGTNGTSTNGASQEQPPLASTSQWSWETAAPAPPKAASDAAPPEPPAAPEPPRAARKTPRRDDLVPPY